MLQKFTVFSMVAVTDMAAAEKFYGETLGLQEVDRNPGGVAYQSGSGRMFVYGAPSGGQNPATSACWEVTGIEDIVASLREKGVTFEHFDSMPGEWQGDILVMDSFMKAAWFKDPSGNTLQLGETIKQN